MGKIVTVATHYSLYEIEDEAFELLPTGMKATPPQIVLEVMVMQGHAKRIGSVGTLTMDAEAAEEYFTEDDAEEDEGPPEGAGPWST